MTRQMASVSVSHRVLLYNVQEEFYATLENVKRTIRTYMLWSVVIGWLGYLSLGAWKVYSSDSLCHFVYPLHGNDWGAEVWWPPSTFYILEPSSNRLYRFKEYSLQKTINDNNAICLKDFYYLAACRPNVPVYLCCLHIVAFYRTSSFFRCNAWVASQIPPGCPFPTPRARH